MGRFKGKSMLVTGGGSGIGAATARYLVDAGAYVTICGRRQESISHVGLELGLLARLCKVTCRGCRSAHP